MSEISLLQCQAELACAELEGKVSEFNRRDGRKLNQTRQISITQNQIKTADCSSLVTLGSTCVLCSINLEIATKDDFDLVEVYKPTDVEENPKNIQVTLNLPFKPDNIGQMNTSDEEQALGYTLEEILKVSEVFPYMSIGDKYYWCLSINLTCIDSDGNLLSACVMAISSALSTLTIPSAIWNEATDTLSVDPEDRVEVKCRPLACVSMVVINGQSIIDPTEEEEYLANGSLTVVFDGDKTKKQPEVLYVSKLSNPPLPVGTIKSLMELATETAKQLVKDSR